jgi:hypothetical protein
VAEDDVHREIGQLPIEIRKLVHVHQEFDMPPVGLDARGKRLQLVERQCAFAELQIDDVAANPAHAEAVQSLNFRDVHVIG